MSRLKPWFVRLPCNNRLPLVVLRHKPPQTVQEIEAEVKLWEHNIRLYFIDNICRNRLGDYVKSPSYNDCIFRIRFVKAIATKDSEILMNTLKQLESRVARGLHYWSMYQHYVFLKIVAERFGALELYAYFDEKQKEVV